MKKIYRDEFVDEYWEKRWEKSGVDDDKFENLDIYPIKYSDIVVKDSKSILEAGCGTGRVFFHYKGKGKNIKGMDYSKNAINNIIQKDNNANVVCASITELPYKDSEFDCVLAFGLFHGLECDEQINQGLKEVNRVLQKGVGKLVISVRLNCLENDIIEYKTKKNNGKGKVFNKFHKWQFDLDDLVYYLKKNGFKVKKENVFYVRNVSFLFKYDFFRKKEMKIRNFKESKARSEGFELNSLGRFIDNFLHNTFPKIFSNLIVVIAEKK